ncbi:MAG: 5'-nucleotidase C-terminal domain-containing protein, partial [Gemmatimonadales bacterium]
DVEYPLGRIVVDALQNTARTEVALIPTRHIEGGLPRGTVTYGDLFDVLPEGVGITKLIVPGSTLKEVIEWALFDGSPSAHIAGLIVRYDPERTPGQRIRNIQFPDGRSVRDNEEYSLAVPSSVHRGDDQYPMLYRFEGEDTGVSAVDALANYLRRLPAPVRTPQARRFTLD